MRALPLATILALASTAHADPGDRWNGETMGWQMVGGSLGGLIGGSALGLAGLGIGLAFERNSKDYATPLICTAVGVAVGGITGAVIGVDLVGDHRNGTGSWYGTTTGIVAGAFLTGGMKLAEDKLHLRLPGVVDALLGTIFIVGGAVVGYQVTASAHPPVAMPLAAFAF